MYSLNQLWLGIVLFLGVIAPAHGIDAPSDHFQGKFYIEGGTLIDGTGEGPRPNPGILITDGRITSIDGSGKDADGAKTISANEKWILPGLFDLHVHVTFLLPGPRRLDDDVVNAIRAERFLERYHEIGVTTVRDVGARDWIGYSIKRAQRQGLMGGARYYTSGPIITQSGGHGTEFQPLHRPLWAVEGDGPWEMRQRVREALKLGADLIKVSPFLTVEEMQAVVDEAHTAGVRVTAHIGGTHDLRKEFGRIAIEAGVDSTEHSYPYGGAEVIKEMVRRNVYVIPTLGFHLRELRGDYAANAEKQSGEWLERNLGHTHETMIQQFQEMHKAGVKFALGTDSNVVDMPTLNELYIQELRGLQTAGLSSAEIIKAATSDAAAAMGLGDSLGSLMAGKHADLILIDEDPHENIESLVYPTLVLQGGRVVCCAESD